MSGFSRKLAVLGTRFGSIDNRFRLDGRTVELPDGLENMGAQMVKEVASKTSDVAGDGTTTATVLAQAIYREGIKNVTAGANPMDLKRGIEKAVVAVVQSLEKLSKPVKGQAIAQVGTISANNDETIGSIIAAVLVVGAGAAYAGTSLLGDDDAGTNSGQNSNNGGGGGGGSCASRPSPWSAGASRPASSLRATRSTSTGSCGSDSRAGCSAFPPG